MNFFFCCRFATAKNELIDRIKQSLVGVTVSDRRTFVGTLETQSNEVRFFFL